MGKLFANNVMKEYFISVPVFIFAFLCGGGIGGIISGVFFGGPLPGVIIGGIGNAMVLFVLFMVAEIVV